MNLSYAHGTATRPLIGETIGNFLDHVAAEFANNEALVSTFEKRRYTYAEFLAEVGRVARALMALGMQKGERVGIWSTNCVAWVLVQFATARIGAILVNINPAYRLYELEFALRQSECNVLISGARFKDADYVQMLHELIPELADTDPDKDLHAEKFPHLRRIVFLAEGGARLSSAAAFTTIEQAASWDSRAPQREEKNHGLLPWPELLSFADHIPLDKLAERQSALEFDDVINIQYTSGTTGFPKGAMLTHHNILNNGFWIGERMRFTHRDRLCIPVPFYHCFGMVLGNLACVTHGATMVLPAPHFSPVHTLEAVARERCTALHGVPTMFIAELDHPQFREFDLSSLRTGIMAGAPCPVEVMKRVMTEMHCREITIACGMTETSPVCNMTEVDDPLKVRVSTIGKVMPHQEQKIVDPATGRILPRGEHGELYYRGYHVMRGYCNNPQATHDMIGADGWLHSGDMAVMDAQGYVQITGRLKDMICRGGEKIFPREVEEFLFTHPKIAEAYVIGVPDAYYGEQVAAWVKVKPGQALTADELQSFCHGQIMDYKIPRYAKFVDDFPKTITGKIQKYRMREISAAETGAESASEEKGGISRLMREHLPTNFNFARDVMERRAKERPDLLALWCVCEGGNVERKITFRQLAEDLRRAASFFNQLGIRRGDRVLVITPRIPQWWVAMLGLIRLGAVPIPGTPLLMHKDIRYRVETAEAAAIITDDEGAAKADGIELKARVLIGSERPGWVSFDAGLRDADPRFDSEPTRSDEPGIIYFTSGTTGPPKMVLHTQASYGLGHRITGELWLDLKPGDLHWCITDTGWAKAAWSCLFGPWQMGACVFAVDVRGKFDPVGSLRTLANYPITTWCAPPTALRLIVREDLSAYRFPQLRHCVSAGEPLNPEVLVAWKAATGQTIYEGYGQTETVCLIANLRSRGDEVRPGSMGKPMPGFTVALLDNELREVRVGNEGEVAVRVQPQRPQGLFREYWCNPAENALRFRGNWYLTGDRATRDEAGYFWFVGRGDDVIKSSSYRIGPFEVESALIEHPAVVEAAVVGKPDSVRGQIVKAFVVLRKGHVPSEDLKCELQEHCKRVTAPYKYPREIEFLPELPKTISGKIRRVELRQRC